MFALNLNRLLLFMHWPCVHMAIYCRSFVLKRNISVLNDCNKAVICHVANIK